MISTFLIGGDEIEGKNYRFFMGAEIQDLFCVDFRLYRSNL